MKEYRFELPESRRTEPEIKVNSYLPNKTLPAQPKRSWWQKAIGVQADPTEFYYYGWLETDDAMGYLRPNDVVLIGESGDDPNGERFFIVKLTSSNYKVRTYEISSLTAIKPFVLSNKKVFKLYTVFEES